MTGDLALLDRDLDSFAVPWHLLLLILLLSFRGSWVLSSPHFFPGKSLLAQISAASIPCNHVDISYTSVQK